MKHYVIGFAFCNEGKEVLLVRKEQPSWQKGKWNGVGGKVNEGELDPLGSMRREFKEETGIEVIHRVHTVTLTCPGGTVFVFKTDLPGERASQIGNGELNDVGEKLQWFRVSLLPRDMMYNLFWMISLQLAKIDWPLMIQESFDIVGEVTEHDPEK